MSIERFALRWPLSFFGFGLLGSLGLIGLAAYVGLLVFWLPHFGMRSNPPVEQTLFLGLWCAAAWGGILWFLLAWVPRMRTALIGFTLVVISFAAGATLVQSDGRARLLPFETHDWDFLRDCADIWVMLCFALIPLYFLMTWGLALLHLARAAPSLAWARSLAGGIRPHMPWLAAVGLVIQGIWLLIYLQGNPPPYVYRLGILPAFGVEELIFGFMIFGSVVAVLLHNCLARSGGWPWGVFVLWSVHGAQVALISSGGRGTFLPFLTENWFLLRNVSATMVPITPWVLIGLSIGLATVALMNRYRD